MDDIVKQAIAKWPNVPDCYGWLGLDERGDWYLRDDAIQAQGPFPQVKGTRLVHEKLIGFIHRNYEADAQGRWFFQNGPQRVYVELAATPWVCRLQPDGSVLAHTGAVLEIHATWLDQEGRLYLQTQRGLGLVHTADMALAAEAVDQGRWTPEPTDAAGLEQQFGFVRSPATQR